MNAGPSNLVERIAIKAGCTNETVEQILNDFGLSLKVTSRRRRSIRIDRLRLRGTKVGEVEAGEFDETFRFGQGVTVIAADNLRGKTSILELITLVLRGDPRSLQVDVLSWLKDLSLDAHINGQHFGFRISFSDSQVIGGQILTGPLMELEASDSTPTPNVAVMSRARDGDEWASQVDAFMMNQLALEEMQVFNKAKNNDEAGTIKAHGWSSYFGVIYPPSGADKVLLGSTPADQLPVKLMQVFLDMPEATRSMRVRALAQRIESEFNAEQRRGRDANVLIAQQLQAALRRLEEADAQLKRLNAEAPVQSLQALAKKSREAGQTLTTARQKLDSITALLADAHTARITDEKALNSMRESKAASVLFHGLDPKSCPRCEHPIGSERRTKELAEHQCSICDTKLQFEDEDEYIERENQAVVALAATQAAEKSLALAKEQAHSNLNRAQAALALIDKEISRAESALQAENRSAAEQEYTAATAVVKALEAMAPEEVQVPLQVRILHAASEILKQDIAHVSADLYEDLSQATKDLGLIFGIKQLENIKIKANGTMDVTKGGGSRSSFSAQSPGERLRLRYALVVALLRTARIRDIAGHPGLLLLDSLKAEEVQEDHAQTLLQGLIDAADAEPGLQVLVTTADRSLAGQVSGLAGTVEPQPGRTTLF